MSATKRFTLGDDGLTMIDHVQHQVALFAMADVAASAVERCNEDSSRAVYFTWKPVREAQPKGPRARC